MAVAALPRRVLGTRIAVSRSSGVVAVGVAGCGRRRLASVGKVSRRSYRHGVAVVGVRGFCRGRHGIKRKIISVSG